MKNIILTMKKKMKEISSWKFFRGTEILLLINNIMFGMALPCWRYQIFCPVWLNLDRKMMWAREAVGLVLEVAYRDRRVRYSLDNIPLRPWTQISCTLTWKHRQPLNTRLVVVTLDFLHAASKVSAEKSLQVSLSPGLLPVLSKRTPTGVKLCL